MNRLKRELRKSGMRLENDYEYLPYNGIETVVVDSENAICREYHVSYGWISWKMLRDGSLVLWD